MKILCKNKYWEIDKDYDINKILYLLIDRPNHINHWDDFVWQNIKNEWHRDYDLPAIISIDVDCHVEWCKYNVLHRKNKKPAIVRHNGSKECYIHGKLIKKLK